MKIDLLIKNSRMVEAHLGVREGHLAVANGRIAAIFYPEHPLPEASRTIDAAGRYLLPGLVDPHFHIAFWGSFVDECRSETPGAALSGITSMVTMLKMKNVPAEYRRESFLEVLPVMREIIEAHSTIDIAIRPYPNTPRQIEEIPRCAELGMTSFKFVTHFPPGSPQALASGTWALPDGELLLALEKIREAGGIAVVHAENQQVTDFFKSKMMAEKRSDLLAWCETRPDFSELEPIQRVALYAHRLGVPVYFVHVTAAASLAFISGVKRQGWKVFAEASPHHLTFTCHSPLGLLGKMNPPLRDEKNLEELWRAMADGTFTCVGSDHMPITKALRTEGDIWTCRWGSPRCETMLPVLLSYGVNRGRISLPRLVELCSYNPARLFGLYPKKGALQPGSDADLVLVDLERRQVVDPSRLPSLSDYSLWEGQELTGWPVMTIRGGEIIAEDGVIKKTGGGRYLFQNRPIIDV